MSAPLAGAGEFEALYQMAITGDPAAAHTSSTAIKQVSQSLQQVSETLKAPLGQLDESWQGQAADAAKTGIGQHVQWAQTTSQELATMATDADAYFNSATHVVEQMQVLQAQIAAASAASAGPAGAVNAAAAEAAIQEATQQAKALFQTHAGVCTSSAPKVAPTAPPTAGGRGGATPAEEASERGGKLVDKEAGSTTDEAGASASGEEGGKTSSAGAVEDPREANGADLGKGAGATESPSEYGSGAGGTVAAAGAGYQPTARTRGSGYSMGGGSSGDSLSGGYEGAGNSRGGVLSDGVLPAGGVLGAGMGDTYRPAKPKARIQGSTPEQSDYADTALSGQPSEHDHQDQQGMPGGGMMSPGMMGGGGAVAASRGQQGQQHESPDYLVDEEDLFNDDEWASPPVIGQK